MTYLVQIVDQAILEPENKSHNFYYYLFPLMKMQQIVSISYLEKNANLNMIIDFHFFIGNNGARI